MKQRYSVIIPVYNTGIYLDKLFNTIYHKNNIKYIKEIIVIDDGSDNSTKEILSFLQSKYGFTLLKNDKNLGVSKARNKGLDIATGEYITFIDSDDFISNNYFKELDKILNNNNVSIIRNLVINYDENKKLVKHSKGLRTDLNNKNGIVNLLKEPEYFVMGANGTTIERKYLGNLRFEDLQEAEDALFFTKYIVENKLFDVYYSNKVKYYYRKRKDGDSLLDKSTEESVD